MSKVLDIGFPATTVSGSSNLEMAFTTNFETDYKVLTDDPGECIITNTKAPIDQPATVRFSQRKIANVYAGTDIDPSVYSPTKSGTATLVERRETWSETDASVPTYRKLLPVKVGIILTLPSDATVTDQAVLNMVFRTIEGLFDNHTVSTAGISNLRHGVMTRSEL